MARVTNPFTPCNNPGLFVRICIVGRIKVRGLDIKKFSVLYLTQHNPVKGNADAIFGGVIYFGKLFLKSIKKNIKNNNIYTRMDLYSVVIR